MIAAFIDFQLRHENPAQTVLRNHAAHGVGDQFLGMLGAHLGDGGVFFAAFPARVGHEFLVCFLFAGYFDLLGVDHNDKIARVQVAGINGFVFPAKMLAIWTARRPRTAPLASTTCHLRWSTLIFGKCVSSKKIPLKGAKNLPNHEGKSTGKLEKGEIGEGVILSCCRKASYSSSHSSEFDLHGR